MVKIIVDTSVIIDYTRANVGPLSQLIKDSKSGACNLYMPAVVVAELWSGKETENNKNANRLEKLLELFKIIDLDRKIAKNSGIISRDCHVSGFDAIVAATALEIGAEVATSNIKHFSEIKNLKLYQH